QDPRDESGRILAHLDVASGALATSGDYERYFEIDGKRYCHLLDPRSGWPVDHWRSISVVAPLAVAAGGSATIAMLMPVADALAFLDSQDLRYLCIDATGARHSR
ncbi:MAG: FAD:protein FMN transferase, partial [Burkholderiaceae bacterium]